MDDVFWSHPPPTLFHNSTQAPSINTPVPTATNILSLFVWVFQTHGVQLVLLVCAQVWDHALEHRHPPSAAISCQ